MIDLSEIHSPADIKGLGVGQLEELAQELRRVLLTKLSRHGGHIGPNLGFLEATVALHYVFDSPADQIVFDVSHQSYVHKMLTGRMAAFVDPERYDDVTGYTNPAESPHDFFTIGHTSTSVALAGGLAKARDMQGGRGNVIAVIGDGSLSGGEAFEGLDFGATLGSNFIVVVNDNDMSIAENHGGIYDNLALLRKTDGKADCNLFRAMGYDYVYVPYGNDIASLVRAFEGVRGSRRPVVVHLNTQKGKGYAPAEADRETFHDGAPFDLATGASLHVSEAPDYSDIFASEMMRHIKSDANVAVITAGTPGVLGFGPQLRAEAGDRFVDVGIAEQDAVALASGMARGGARPVFGVVSSFLQRAYDQLSQDVAINGTAPVVNIFYGTVVGMTDVTHLGWFDIALVSNIPGWVYLAPTCVEEYRAMLDWAVHQKDYPVAVRVPGVSVVSRPGDYAVDYGRELNRAEVVHRGSGVAIIAAGATFATALKAAEILRSRGIDATLVNPRYLSGLDTALLEDLRGDHSLVITAEDGCLDGGFGEKVARYYGADGGMRVRCAGVAKQFLDRYDISAVLAASHLTADTLADLAQ